MLRTTREELALSLINYSPPEYMIPCWREDIRTEFISLPSCGDYETDRLPVDQQSFVFVLCFDLTDINSLEFWVMEKFFPEVAKYSRFKSSVLVSLNRDKRDDILSSCDMASEDVRNIVTRDKGSAASQIMKWSVYVELTEIGKGGN